MVTEHEKIEPGPHVPVIVGGGPIGLTMALGLAHHGVHCVLVEQDPEAERESRTLNLWPRVLEMFREWGLLEALMARGTFVDELEALDARTDRSLLSFKFPVLDPVTPLAGALMIPQNVTENVLRERVAAEPGCRVIVGRCVGVTQDDDEVTVRLETSEGPRELTTSYCIAADGARSTVRKELGISMEGTTSEQRMVLSDERITDRAEGRLRFGIREPGFHVALKFGEQQWRLMSSIPTGMSDEDAMKESVVGDRVEALFGHRRHKTEWISTFTVHKRVAERYRVGRVFLTGDAAHLISPIGGQGMSSGMLDAENLAWKLSAVLRGDGGEPLLESYHGERHWVMETKISQNAEAATQAEFSSPPLAKRIMIRVLAQFVKIPRLRAAVARNLAMLELRYPTSPVLVGEHKLVGARISDPATETGGRLSDRLPKGFCIVLVNGAADLESDLGAEVLRLRRAPKSWRLREPAAVILRPDRHAGAVLTNPSTSEVRAALRTALGQETPLSAHADRIAIESEVHHDVH